MIHTEIGSETDRDGRSFVSAPLNRRGYLLYGPYVKLAPGAYAVTFEIMAVRETANEFAVCGRADVAVEEGTRVLAQTALFAPRLVSHPTVTLQFVLERDAEVEFRVYSTGKVPMIAHAHPSLQRMPVEEARYCPLFPTSYRAKNAFLERHFAHFRFLYENGAEVSEDESGSTVEFRGARFLVSAAEEFQVINEVFFNKDYDVVTPRRMVFVDIGMNSGLVSLFAAGNKDVWKIYGFEPFRAPFQRALANFQLNPTIAAKIDPKNIALGDSNRSVEVLSTPESTIGMSIRGAAAGEPEVITIRDAGPVLEEIVSEAAFHQCDVVVKLDCEGSEFAIFESLLAYKLLPRISVIMVEWHKWWAADKNERTLIDPLNNNGFAVFDRTTPANIYAGVLYAVNTKIKT